MSDDARDGYDRERLARVLGEKDRPRNVYLTGDGSVIHVNGAHFRVQWFFDLVEEAARPSARAARAPEEVDRLVDRFLAWPLPDTLRSDLCATQPGPSRSGTNLLTADEARQMFEHVLGDDE